MPGECVGADERMGEWKLLKMYITDGTMTKILMK